jgi:hypothetical protein
MAGVAEADTTVVPHPLAVVPAVPAVTTNPLSLTAVLPHSLTVSTPAVGNPVGFEQYFKRTAEHMFGSEVTGTLNYDERLALALTMIELGDDVVDLNFDTSRILITTTYENKNLFKQAMAKHLKGTGYPVRELMTFSMKAKITNKLQKLFLSQQQLQISKRCIDQKTNCV